MMLPVLYSFRRCPYAMRARLAIVANNVRVELREVVLRSKPMAMIEASPKGTVPILVLPDGTVIDESVEIMRWTLPEADRAGWPIDADAGMISANDGSFKHHLDRYKYADRYGADALRHRDAAIEFLRKLDEQVQDRPDLRGEEPSMTDLAIVPFVRQFAETDRGYFDSLPFASRHNWLARHLASPLFAQIMIRSTPWQAGNVRTVFPQPVSAPERID